MADEPVPAPPSMPQIAGSQPSSSVGRRDTDTEFDRENMRKTKPGFKRFALTLSVLISFLLGLPFLLKSVEIYRSPLPFRKIDELFAAVESSPLHFPCKFQTVFVGFDGLTFTAEELSVLTQSHMRTIAGKDSGSCGGCSYNSTVTVALGSGSDCSVSGNLPLWNCEELNELTRDENLVKYDDESLDEYFELFLDSHGSHSNSQKVYTVFVVRREEEKNVKSLIGKYRHAWILGKVSVDEAVKMVAEIFVEGFVRGWRKETSIGGEFMPVGADGRIVLSFSLLNADPHDRTYSWEFQDIDENILAPVIDALKPLADIRVESQVLYHTPKSSFSYWDDNLGSYIFTKKDLPFFVWLPLAFLWLTSELPLKVNSNEWHLDTSVEAGGRSKILHFVVYVPAAAECPLLFRLPNGEISPTNGFISPMWGGVVVWNPSDCSKDSSVEPHLRRKISPEDTRKVFEVFLAQIRQLFGMNSEHSDASNSLRHSFRQLTVERGFTEWELDVLSRLHTCFKLHQCTTTLESLSRLVQSLPRMIIKDEIGKQVKYSLEAAKLALSNASEGIYDASAVSSRQARSFAEDAFYHPSMMSVSYFSFEHCFAVYSPFFLPVSLHVLLAALREWKKRKQESRKYRVWKAKQL